MSDVDTHEAPPSPFRDGVPQLAAPEHLHAAWGGLDLQAQLAEDEVATAEVADGQQERESVVPVSRVLVLVGHEVDQQGPHQEGLAGAPGLEVDVVQLGDLVRNAGVLLQQVWVEDLEKEPGYLGACAEGAVAQLVKLVKDVSVFRHSLSGQVFGGIRLLFAVWVTYLAAASDVEDT